MVDWWHVVLLLSILELNIISPATVCLVHKSPVAQQPGHQPRPPPHGRQHERGDALALHPVHVLGRDPGEQLGAGHEARVRAARGGGGQQQEAVTLRVSAPGHEEPQHRLLAVQTRQPGRAQLAPAPHLGW